MRPVLPVALALGLGAAASCFNEDFLLGAYCVREEDCADDQCCAANRCRPETGTHCEREVDANSPYEWAYMACTRDDECLVHGLPHCLFYMGAKTGFCTDPCFKEPTDCEIHPSSYYRVCVTVPEGDHARELCALECEKSRFCPGGMTCHEGVCVPEAAP